MRTLDAREIPQAPLWVLRAIVLTLPLTIGPAIQATVQKDPTGNVPEALAWISWGLLLLAMLVPRTIGLTAVRLLCPAAIFGSAIAAFHTSWQRGLLGIVAAVALCCIAFSSHVARSLVNGAAYEGESRFPLRIPPPVLFLALPIAVLVFFSGIATGPLLLGNSHTIAGPFAVLIGFPIAAFAARSVHSLSKRWAVIVPAGVTLVDRVSLAEATLLHSGTIEAVRVQRFADPGDSLDLRVGAIRSAINVTMNRTVVINTKHGPRKTQSVLFSPVATRAFATQFQERLVEIRSHIG